MIITKQAQLDLLAKYQKENNLDKCEGFVDGINAIIGFVNAQTETSTREHNDLEIQKHIEYNCRNIEGGEIMDEQAFYEGAKWYRDCR